MPECAEGMPASLACMAVPPMGVLVCEATIAAWHPAHAEAPTYSPRDVTCCVGQKPGSARWSSVESWARTTRETCGQRMTKRTRTGRRRNRRLPPITIFDAKNGPRLSVEGRREGINAHELGGEPQRGETLRNSGARYRHRY